MTARANIRTDHYLPDFALAAKLKLPKGLAAVFKPDLKVGVVMADGGEATEVLFYQLDHQPLERVLPGLLERTLARGWRAVVQSGDRERLEALDATLWTYREDSFLPHGAKKDGHAADQPVYLTMEEETPNGARVCFLVEGASRTDVAPFIRVVHLFDGRNEDAARHAREQWAAAKASGLAVTYWRQDENGRWNKMA